MDIQKIMAEVHYYSQNESANFRKVIELTQNLLDHNLQHSSIYFYKGRAHQEIGENDEAIKNYRFSILIGDDSTDERGLSWTKIQSRNNLANIYFDLDNYDDCIETSSHNLNLFENETNMDSNQFLYLNSLYLTAHCYYLKFAKLKNSYFLDNLAVQYQLISARQNLPIGAKYILKAIELKPNNVDYLFVAGMLFKLMDDNENARTYFTKAAVLGDKQSEIKLRTL